MFPSRLFLRLFEDYMLTKLGAVFFEFNLALYQLLILARPIDLASGFIS